MVEYNFIAPGSDNGHYIVEKTINRYAFSPDQFIDRKDWIQGLIPEIFEMLAMEPRIRLFDSEFGISGLPIIPGVFRPTKNYLCMTYKLFPLEHEIGHWIEMRNPLRWLMPEMGLSVWQNDPSPNNYLIGLARESRVIAIENRLLINGENLLLKRNPLNNMYHWFPLAEKFLPFKKFSNMKELRQWTDFIRDKAFNDYPLERIIHEWKLRINAYREWAETKE